MFKEETLFILGAGASYPYGYPLGKDLITQIINNIKKDPIYLPILHNTRRKYYYNENNGIEQDGKLVNGYNFSDFKEYFEELYNSQKDSNITYILNSFGTNIVQYKQIKLKQIEEFFNLKKALIEFDPVSIDTFLRDHPSHTEAGKIMIIYSLLKCEDKNRFSLETRSNSDNWYSYLINDILSGINKVEEIFNNKLNIITFNYSVDLDYCLLSKLSNIEILKNKSGSDFIKKLQDEKIYHVYGQLYSDNIIETYGHFYQNPNITELIVELNTHRFLKAIQSKEQIKLIQSERNKKNVYKELIRNAKEIIIIGFGFDRDNLNILGFPDQFGLYIEYLKGKKLNYMDFKGQMNSLFGQFSNIPGNPDNFIITRSIGESIINAYQNDFKIYLY